MSPPNIEEIGILDITEGELYPILSALNMGILITNSIGEIKYYSPMHAKMDGLSPEEVLGRKVFEVYDLDMESSLVMRCLRTLRPIVECPVIYKTKNGQIVDSIHNVIPLSKNGEIVGTISIIKDYQMVNDATGASKNKTTQLSFTGDTDFSLDDILGSSSALLNAVNRARMASQTNSPVLIHGETGTGKELFAQSIHNLSNRKGARYIAVNCAAIPDTLLEGILFGTSKGAFTGALDKAGLFERANGGTIFLDEINSMSKEMQPKLLRVIQEKRVCRIGSHRELKLDVKIISSINTTLEQAVLSGEVRRDLLYRLSVVYISLPPLKERKGDIPLLIDHFVDKYNKLMKKNIVGVSSEVMRLFEHHDWPGNIRELENVIEGSFNIVGQDQLVEKWHLTSGFEMLENKLDIIGNNDIEKYAYASEQERVPKESLAYSANPEEIEIRNIQEALFDAEGNISDAAVILGVSRQTFYRRIKTLKIELPKKDGGKQRQQIITTLEQFDGNITHTARALGISRQLLSYRIKKMGIDRSLLTKKQENSP